MTARDFLEHLDCVRASGTGWTARCPAHEDTRNSLSVSEGADGRTLLHCHAGCSTESILAALDLTGRDLFAQEALHGKDGNDIVYRYADERGVTLFEVVRRPGKQFAQRRPDGHWGLNGVRRVLYRLSEVLAAVAKGERVYITEGEKDADNLRRHGLTATTCAGGASAKWLDEYSQALAGADVLVLPDNDEPGRKHAEKVSKALAGVAASVRVVELPGLPPKGDVSDWLSSGHTKDDLLALVEGATASPPTESQTAGLINAGEFFKTWKHDVLHGEPPKLFACGGPEWAALEHGPGLMTLIGAAPGHGKTCLVMQVVIDALRTDDSLHVLVANCEMSPGVLFERQLARISGVPLNLVRFRKLDADYAPVSLALDEMERIAPRLAFHTGAMTLKAVSESADAHRADWIVIDYLQRFRVDGTGDREQRVEIDAMMQTLRGFCFAGRAVTVVSSVARQRSSGGSSYAGRGLASFRGSGELEFAVDSAWTLERKDSDLIAFRCLKNRHGSMPTLELRLDGARQTFDVVSSDGHESAHDTTALVETVAAWGDDGEPF